MDLCRHRQWSSRMKPPAVSLLGERRISSALSLSYVDISNAAFELEKCRISNLNQSDRHSTISIKNAIKKTKTLPLTNSNKISKSSKFSKSCKSVIDCCESDGIILNVKLRKKLSQSLKNINISSQNSSENKINNRFSQSLKESQQISDYNEMNITENYVAQILSDPGAGNFRSMDELRILQSNYHSDR